MVEKLADIPSGAGGDKARAKKGVNIRLISWPEARLLMSCICKSLKFTNTVIALPLPPSGQKS